MGELSKLPNIGKTLNGDFKCIGRFETKLDTVKISY